MGKTAIYRYKGREAGFDSTTALWMARMLVGEGWQSGLGSAVLWSMLNRYLYSKHRWPSFLHMIRDFSVPINDAWLPGGAKFEEHKNYVNQYSKWQTSDKAIARRKKIRAMQWSDMPKGVQTLVAKFITGELAYPLKFGSKKYNNFASYEGLEKKYPGGVFYGRTYFLQDHPMPKGNIEIVRGAGYNPGKPMVESTGDGVGVGVLLLALGAGLYWYLRSKKK